MKASSAHSTTPSLEQSWPTRTARATNPRQGRSGRTISLIASTVLLAWALAACGSPAESFSKNEQAALLKVNDVVAAQASYKNDPGMGATAEVRVTAAPDADLQSVLKDSLHAFAGAVGSVKPSTSVSFYVYTEAAPEGGIRPNAVGLQQSPQVSQIQAWTAAN